MSLLDKFRALVRREPAGGGLAIMPANPWGPDWRSRIEGMSVPTLFATQPDLQAVVAFRAREVAALPVHLYRIRDGEHEKLDSPLASLFVKPNGHQTGYELMRDLVSTLDLYGRAFWYVYPSATAPAGYEIEPLHPEWVVGGEGGDVYAPDVWEVRPPWRFQSLKLPAANVVQFRSYAPDGVTVVSPIQSLKNVLAEQVAAWEFRREVWHRGGRVGAYVSRPADAPEWDDDALERFRASWHEFQRGGARAGETPLLEDGMKIERVGFSAREEQWTEAAKLSLRTVCRVYHVSPAMLGDDTATSYASAREESRKLYTSTLAPIIREIEQRITEYVLPIVAPGETGLAVKLNIDAKLAGSFEEQASVLSTATGAPWLLVNEARALRNLPAVDGGDTLVVPLNVTAGGQASPQDGGRPSVAVENARRAGDLEAADDTDNEEAS